MDSLRKDVAVEQPGEDQCPDGYEWMRVRAAGGPNVLGIDKPEDDVDGLNRALIMCGDLDMQGNSIINSSGYGPSTASHALYIQTQGNSRGSNFPEDPYPRVNCFLPIKNDMAVDKKRGNYLGESFYVRGFSMSKPNAGKFIKKLAENPAGAPSEYTDDYVPFLIGPRTDVLLLTRKGEPDWPAGQVALFQSGDQGDKWPRIDTAPVLDPPPTLAPIDNANRDNTPQNVWYFPATAPQGSVYKIHWKCKLDICADTDPPNVLDYPLPYEDGFIKGKSIFEVCLLGRVHWDGTGEPQPWADATTLDGYSGAGIITNNQETRWTFVNSAQDNMLGPQHRDADPQNNEDLYGSWRTFEGECVFVQQQGPPGMDLTLGIKLNYAFNPAPAGNPYMAFFLNGWSWKHETIWNGKPFINQLQKTVQPPPYFTP
jgi:hypothetical protein